MQLGQAAGGNVEFHLYPKVGHAYMNGKSPERQAWLGLCLSWQWQSTNASIDGMSSYLKIRAGFTAEAVQKMEMMKFPVSRPYGQLFLATTARGTYQPCTCWWQDAT